MTSVRLRMSVSGNTKTVYVSHLGKEVREGMSAGILLTKWDSNTYIYKLCTLWLTIIYSICGDSVAVRARF